MPLELGEMINGGAAWFGRSRLLSSVLRNPVVVALLITAVAMILIFSIFGVNVKKHGWRPVIKTGFWLGLVTSALIFVHYYISDQSFNDYYSNQNIKEMVESIQSSSQVTGGYDVMELLQHEAPDTMAAPVTPAAPVTTAAPVTPSMRPANLSMDEVLVLPSQIPPPPTKIEKAE